jgi:hypothetical protein
MVLKPDFANKGSCWGRADWVVPVVWHAVISTDTTMAMAIFVSINSFFIYLVLRVYWFFISYKKSKAKSKTLIVRRVDWWSS